MLFIFVWGRFVPAKQRFVSLLLLHLLEVYKPAGRVWGLLGALDEDGPILWNRHFTVESGSRVPGLNVNSHIEFAGTFAAENTVSWRNVGVVAADGCTDVSLAGNKIVGRIKPNPTEVRHQDVNPGVAGVRS